MRAVVASGALLRQAQRAELAGVGLLAGFLASMVASIVGGGWRATPSISFKKIGGEAKIHALVERFYDLIDLEPEYPALRATHGTDLAKARQHLFWFLCGWLGGPQRYTDRFGHPRLRARHMPFSIGVRERDQWLACMDQAMGETCVPAALREG